MIENRKESNKEVSSGSSGESEKTIRVLALLEANYVSGAARAVLEFSREAMVERPRVPRFVITVVNFLRTGHPTETAFTRKVCTLNLSHETVFERRAFDFKILPQLEEIVARLRPDLIWSNSVKSHFLVRLAGLARETAWVAYHHGYTATDSKMLVYNQLDRWSLRAADRVLTVCRPFANQLETRGVRPEKIRVQAMPAQCIEAVPAESLEALKRRLRLPAGTTVLLSVGRLSREKGHADLLRAFRKLCDSGLAPLRLIVAGDGPERERLNQLKRDLQLDENVIFSGHVDDIRPYYALADIFVLLSHSEGTPNVLLEAMAAEVPIVATSVGGIPEFTGGGKAALLIDKRDINGLTKAVARLLKEPDLRALLIHGGRTVVENSSSENYFRVLAEVFREAIERAD